MSWWDVNFAASASVGAGFAPGSFQQGGWALAFLMTGVVFVCSMVSFAAYTSLTSIVYWTQQLQARGHIVGADHSVLTAVTGASPFRATQPFRALSWSETPLHDSDEKKTAKKRKGRQQQLAPPPSSLYIVPESSMMVHFFTGSETFTRCFEFCQFTFGYSSMILKTATAVDIMYTFMLASPNIQERASPLVSALTTPTGMSVAVFLIMAVCLLVPMPLSANMVKLADVSMVLIQLCLVTFLTSLAITVEWSREGPKATHGALAATLPQDANHLSALFPFAKRFFFVIAASATLFTPHAGTPVVFRGPPSNLATLPARALHQLHASTSSVAYYMFLGVVYDIVLPLGRTTPRVALLNFVDYRKWLAGADAYEWVMVIFVLAPLVHLVSVTRGMIETFLNTLLRIASVSPLVPRAVLSFCFSSQPLLHG